MKRKINFKNTTNIGMNEWFLGATNTTNTTKAAQVLLLFPVLQPTDLNPWFEAGSCVSTNEIFCMLFI